MLDIFDQGGMPHSMLFHNPDVDIRPKIGEVISFQALRDPKWYRHELLEGIEFAVNPPSVDELHAAPKEQYRHDR